MHPLDSILQQVIIGNELIAYLVGFVAMLTFLGMVMTLVSIYRAHLQHRDTTRLLEEMRRSSERQNYYLFRKLGPIELP